MIIGIDEAGRGPVIGPMVIAGVMAEPDLEKEFIKLGVKDSKRLSPGRREELTEVIRKRCSVHTEILAPEQIDSRREKESLNVIEEKAYAAVLAKLLIDMDSKQIEKITAIVDSVDVDEQRFAKSIKSHLPDGLNKIKIISKHKADDIYPIVSAASIIAKTLRDSKVEEISEELGTAIGSGYPSDPVTKEFLKQWLKEKGELPPHVRRSWKTVKRLIENRNTTFMTLDDYTKPEE